jgi:lipid II:glycine glycyltransferase (peptidoglycan interpeptide bridge formation enzyme)
MNFNTVYTNEIDTLTFLNDDEYPLYFSKKYLDFEKQNGNESILFYADNNTVIPCRIYTKFIFKFLKPYCPPYKNGNRLSAEEERQFLNEWVKYLKTTNQFHRIIQSYTMDVFSSYPDNSVYGPFGQIYFDLENQTEEELFNKFASRYKRYVREIESAGNAIEIKTDNAQLDVLFKLYSDLHKSQNLYFDNYNYMSSMYKALAPDNCTVTSLYYDGDIEGSLLVTHNSKEAYFLFGGAVYPTKSNGSIKYLHWEVVRKLKQKNVKKAILGGYRLSDVKGTKLNGIQEFKIRFGAEIKKGFLWKMDLNPSMAKLYDNLTALQAKLKGNKIQIDVIDYEKDREVII